MGKYSEYLKDPRWQKKRLETMNRDEWTCRYCGENKKTLNVHHIFYYEEFAYPWEYQDAHLITLCDKCHGRDHEVDDNLVSMVIESLNSKGILKIDIIMFLIFIYHSTPKNGRYSFIDTNNYIKKNLIDVGKREFDESLIKKKEPKN